MKIGLAISGRKMVHGDVAGRMYALVREKKLNSGAFWAAWNERRGSGSVDLSLDSISCKFVFSDLSRQEFSGVQTKILQNKTPDYDSAPAEVYRVMLDAFIKQYEMRGINMADNNIKFKLNIADIKFKYPRSENKSITTIDHDFLESIKHKIKNEHLNSYQIQAVLLAAESAISELIEKREIESVETTK